MIKDKSRRQKGLSIYAYNQQNAKSYGAKAAHRKVESMRNNKQLKEQSRSKLIRIS